MERTGDQTANVLLVSARSKMIRKAHNYAVRIFISLNCISWPASGRSTCWAIPTYAGFGAALPLTGRPTPRSEPCALIPGSGPIRSAGRIPSRKRRPTPWRPGRSSSSPSPAATLNPTARGASAHAGRVSNAEGIKCPLQGARCRFYRAFFGPKTPENRRFFQGETAWKFSGFSRPFAIIFVTSQRVSSGEQERPRDRSFLRVDSVSP